MCTFMNHISSYFPRVRCARVTAEKTFVKTNTGSLLSVNVVCVCVCMHVTLFVNKGTEMLLYIFHSWCAFPLLI